jgi:NADPH:quinone reductase-like Zn-dependent oxidoreductase
MMKNKKVIISEFGGPEMLQIIEETPLPEPQPGEVRVKVLAASANFTDIMIRAGTYPDVNKKPPFTPGYDMVGVIDKLGEGVTDYEVGQRVADMTVTGAYAQYITRPAGTLVPLPEDLDPHQAVCLILSFLTAYQMLHRVAEVKGAQTILVHGAGGSVGSACVQLAVQEGLQVFGTDQKDKHPLISELGAIPIDYKQEDFVDRVLQETKTGVDAVFDPIGGEHFRRSFKALAPEGILVAFGFYKATLGASGSIPLDFLKLQLWNLLPNGRKTRFFSIGALRDKHPDWFKKDLAHLFNLLAAEKITPLIWKKLPLEQAAEAHHLIENAVPTGKIVLIPHSGAL